MTTEADEFPEPTRPPESVDWYSTRAAMVEIGKALEPLTSEMRARVLASAAILAGTVDRVLDILSGNSEL